jgi:glycosyltransferase involved in cell wall biosynthesis
MARVVQVVTTNNFAGVERYVCNTATELSARGWDVTVVGGHPRDMREALADDVAWLPGATPAQALRSLTKLRRQDVCHAHMTIGEAVAIAARPLHRAAIVSTRHFAAHRGASRLGRMLGPLISAKLDRQIAVTEFVADRVERRPDAVIRNGIAPLPHLWREANRVVLVLQRVEREKDTVTALRAWQMSRMFEEGWSLRVVGDGAERMELESWVAANRVPGVAFKGWSSDVTTDFASAGILLAPAPTDSFGFAVLEAMSAGVPVVACAAGGHLETVGRTADASLFPPGDVDAAAAALRELLRDPVRAAASSAARELVRAEFTIERHVDRLIPEYEAATSSRQKRRRSKAKPGNEGLRELVVCSLEAWDEVWRRNQFLVGNLLRRNPQLRVLFVEPPADPLFDLSQRRPPQPPRLRSLAADGRLRAFRPLKVLPRRAGPIADRLLRSQVAGAAGVMGFSQPILWINDVTYAPLIAAKEWPSVYDVTDDWLQAPFPPREIDRLRRLDELALETADEVVVCSRALASTRGARREVTLIRNGIDAEHFRRPRSRPSDLPASPVAVYVGSLHDSRLDVDLVADVACALPHVRLALVGPNSLSRESQATLERLSNVMLLGPRPYDDVPAYLQHSDVVIVPHRISSFTDSLDPIKVHECLVIDTPTVATPVAGFREHAEELHVVDRSAFPERVAKALTAGWRIPRTHTVGSWEQRASEFELVLRRALRCESTSRGASSLRAAPTCRPSGSTDLRGGDPEAGRLLEGG